MFSYLVRIQSKYKKQVLHSVDDFSAFNVQYLGQHLLSNCLKILFKEIC